MDQALVGHAGPALELLLDRLTAKAAAGHLEPVLLDVLTNPREVSVPGKVKVGQAWGFAISKIRESVLSEGES